jgi:ABC-type arginine transport system ATPase subunit
MKRRIDEAPVASDDEGGSGQSNKRARALMQSPSVACQATPATPSLPPELWCHILSFLKNRSLFGSTSLVCSSWRYARPHLHTLRVLGELKSGSLLF